MEGIKKSFVGAEAQRRKRSDYKARYLTMRGYVFLMAAAMGLVVVGMIGFFAGAR